MKNPRDCDCGRVWTEVLLNVFTLISLSELVNEEKVEIFFLLCCPHWSSFAWDFYDLPPPFSQPSGDYARLWSFTWQLWMLAGSCPAQPLHRRTCDKST